MDNLMLALTLLVIEVMFIFMLFTGLFTYRYLKKNKRSSFSVERAKKNSNHKLIKQYTDKLYKSSESLQNTYSKYAKELGINYPITQNYPDAPVLIACLHCHHDYILSEISAVEMGEISIQKLEKYENKFNTIIAEFEEIEKRLLGGLSTASKDSEEIKKLQEKITELKESSSSDDSYLFELKKQSIFHKQESKKLLQQINKLRDRINELEQEQISDANQAENLSNQIRDTLVKEKEELKKMLSDANDRISDLEAYKIRFNELQSQVSSESSANKDLRKDIRVQVEGTESEDEIDKLINEYETVRSSLDDFMERPDVAPMVGITAAENDEKIQELNEFIDGIAGNICDELKADTFHLAELNSAESDTVVKLKTQLKEVTIDRDRLEANLLDLERTIAQKGDVIIKLENEISSRQKSISDLQERVHQLSTKSSNIAELQLTVERFSRQSMTMMQQIMDLEEENKELKKRIN